ITGLLSHTINNKQSHAYNLAQHFIRLAIKMIQFKAFTGTVVSMNDLNSSEYGEGCSKMIALQNEEDAPVNFILTPSTYVVNQDMITIGDTVTGYYDANAPAILIYPPQYQS